MTTQPTTTKEALEPCPFCGDKLPQIVKTCTPPAIWSVLCIGCDAVQQGDTQQGAITKWNSRISAPIVAPEVDEALIRLLLDWRKWYSEDIFSPWTIEEAQAVHAQFPDAADRIAAASARGTIDRIVEDIQEGKHAAPASPVAPQQSERDKGTPLCAVHQRLEDVGRLECEIGNDCVACSLNERRELLALIAPFAAEGNTEDSVTVLRRVAEFYETHAGEGRVVVSYPAPASPAALRDEADQKESMNMVAERVKTIMETTIIKCDLKTIEDALNSILLDLVDMDTANAPMLPSYCRETADFIGKRVEVARQAIARIKTVVERATPPSTLAKAATEEIVKGWFWHLPERDQNRARINIEQIIERCLSAAANDAE